MKITRVISQQEYTENVMLVIDDLLIEAQENNYRCVDVALVMGAQVVANLGGVPASVKGVAVYTCLCVPPDWIGVIAREEWADHVKTWHTWS